MTWIRVDTTLPRETIIGDLCERFGLELATGIGLYVSTQLGFADHRKDGRVVEPGVEGERALVNSVTLEQWANWRGEPGAFASFFRAQAVERRTEERDPPGRIQGWWRQEALIARQERDREKRRLTPRKPPGNPPETPGGSMGYVDGRQKTVNGDGKGKLSTTGSGQNSDPQKPPENPRGSNGGPPDRSGGTQYVLRCTGACNRGLQANPSFTPSHQFNELVASAQTVHTDWIDAGVPVVLAEQTIYEIARRYRPTVRRRQPTTLAYFRQAVLEAFEKAQAQDATGELVAGLPKPGEAISEGERLARSLEREAAAEAP